MYFEIYHVHVNKMFIKNGPQIFFIFFWEKNDLRKTISSNGCQFED